MAGTKGRSGGKRKPAKLSANQKSKQPSKPKSLSAKAGKFWDEIVALLPPGILAPIDTYELTFLVNLLAQAEAITNKLKQDPLDAGLQRLYLQTFKEVHRLSAVFGLNPADRYKLQIEQPAGSGSEDPFESFLKKRMSRKQ